MDVNKDSSRKAKARTKDSGFVLKDNQGPRPRTTSVYTVHPTAGYIHMAICFSYILF